VYPQGIHNAHCLCCPVENRRAETISAGTPQITAVGYPVPPPNADLRVDADWVLAHLKNPKVVLIDARTPAEYSGTNVQAAHG